MPRITTHANRDRIAFCEGVLGKVGLSIALCLAQAGPVFAGESTPPLAITTFHGNSMRMGWNDQETVLTPATVSSSAFAMLGTVALDGQVDSQPLYVGSQAIARGVHNVVYVATEADSIYAVDAESGKVLVKKNFGQAVPMARLPGACNNNAATVGITATPVIDTAAGTLFAIAYAMENGDPVYRIHELDLATLTDKIPSVVVAATARLAGGSVYDFNPAGSRQRAALLEANGNIYAGFASFCDLDANVSRGWVLGWKAATLTPLPRLDLTNKRTASPSDFFLTSIWMSGNGLASDEAGNLLFATGNADYSGTTYNQITNLAESVVKLSPDLTRVESYFTPDAPSFDVASLDQGDDDFGAGGVLVLPQQSGAYPRLAVAAGKIGRMYLLNRDNLGGFHAGLDHVLESADIGGCWCGESYFQGADGIGRVVSSGGSNAIVWKVETGRARPRLVRESASETVPDGEDPGFFTTVSSNGTQANSQVIWAVSRPVSAQIPTVTLYAFDPSSFDLIGQNATLFSGAAGIWPNINTNATIMPLVANGRVYVAAYESLTIFGLQGGAAITGATTGPTRTENAEAKLPGHAVYGTLLAAGELTMTLRTRTGATITVDAAPAIAAHNSAVPVAGRAFLVRGTTDSSGILHASSILRAKPSPALWPPDR